LRGVETIKRQTRAAYGLLVLGQSVGADLAYGYRLNARTVCDMISALQLRYACGAIQVSSAYTFAI